MALIKTNARSASVLDATILTGNLPAISGASLTGLTSGLTESDMWVLTANITGDTEPITTFSRVDDDGQGHMGTGMSKAHKIHLVGSTITVSGTTYSPSVRGIAKEIYVLTVW